MKALGAGVALLLAANAPAARAVGQPASTSPAVPGHGMALPEALEYARAHQPSILAARARLAATELDTRVPGAMYLPRLAASVQGYAATTNNSTALYVSAPGLDLPRVGGTAANTKRWSPDPSTLAALGVRQELYDFGRISALQALTNAGVEVERGRTDLARLDLDLAVENAFFG
ncbi:MAG TPA: TolC family protein, partial [Anaeromyxobacteraceae bacterium]